VTLAYPGTWIRDDVYATHGHYMDCHNTVPTIECLSIAATARAIGGLPAGRVTPADYEALIGPPYGLTYTLAQAPGRLRRVLAGSMSRDVWTRLNGGTAGIRGRRLAAAAMGKVLFPAAVAAINRAGLGPFDTDLSIEALRRAGLRAMGTVIEALGVEADHVIFGHTHRSGPHPGDQGWELAGGTRLYNSGSWIYERAFLGDDPQASPYHPGNAIEIGDTGPPRLRRLIA
jgi:hypothetical protein